MHRILATLAFALLPLVLARATATPAGDGFVRITPSEVHWTDIPGGLGAQMAVIAGDPSGPGLYVVRVRFPPHVMDLPHFHPHVRYVTVPQGTWYAGTGAKFDPAHAVPLPAGSVMVHPAKAVHWDGSRTDDAVIVQIVGDGPGTSIPLDPHAPGWVHVGG